LARWTASSSSTRPSPAGVRATMRPRPSRSDGRRVT
jgi:hypothetical protein